MKEPTPGNETHVTMLPEEANDAVKKMNMERTLPGFVKCVSFPAPGKSGVRTALIMQRYLLTMIECSVSREEAKALACALVTHFGFTPDELDNEEDKL